MKVSVFIATSLDGFIAREDGGLDWLPENPEPHGYEEFMASMDAVVIGRKTFETVLGFGGWAYGKKPVVVLSTTLKTLNLPPEAVCDLMSGDPEQIVRDLMKRGWQNIYLDGGVTIQRFLRAGLVDRMVITKIPVLLGAGVPLFGPLSKDLPLHHIETKTYPSGLVQSEYVSL